MSDDDDRGWRQDLWRPDRHALAGLILVVAEAAQRCDLLGWMRECADDPADARRWWRAMGHVLFDIPSPASSWPELYADSAGTPSSGDHGSEHGSELSDFEDEPIDNRPRFEPDDEDNPFADFGR